jgi:hypothetical protein
MSFMVVTVALGACGGDDASATLEELMDPESCAECHPKHYREWSGSMHAYAADDPVFLAMNARGQREADIGDFCVKCHAPMAVELGLTDDGLNLDQIDQKYKGVTCYFCHSVKEVGGTHNNPLVLADDLVMRGGIRDPVSNGFHKMAYSPLHDSGSIESASVCGSCHDIVNNHDVHMERTFSEWSDSVFNQPGLAGASCQNCHMFFEPGVVADFEGVPLRDVRDHAFPGVDVAITDWPEKEAQLEGIQRDLNFAINPFLCVNPGPGGVELELILDNVGGGHALPSGAGQDRRQWAEVIAYDDNDQVMWSTGVVADGEPVADVAAADSNLWQMRDFATDGNGDEVHMFWEIEQIESHLLDWATDPMLPHTVTRTFQNIGDPARVTVLLKLRPIGLDVIDDLIDSDDLDESFRDEFPTFELEGTRLEWRRDDHGLGCLCRSGPCTL